MVIDFVRGWRGERCVPDVYGRFFSDTARTAKVPMLWLYAEHDPYDSASAIRGDRAAFEQAGGQGLFSSFPTLASIGMTWRISRCSGVPLWRPMAEALDTTRIHRVAGPIGARMALVTAHPCRAYHMLTDLLFVEIGAADLRFHLRQPLPIGGVAAEVDELIDIGILADPFAFQLGFSLLADNHIGILLMNRIHRAVAVHAYGFQYLD